MEYRRRQVKVFYSGRVQGVGFRYTVKTLTHGFEVIGTIRNLSDGRVQLTAEGEHDELDAFIEAIRSAGVGPLIRNEEIQWGEAQNRFRGFEIIS